MKTEDAYVTIQISNDGPEDAIPHSWASVLRKCIEDCIDESVAPHPMRTLSDSLSSWNLINLFDEENVGDLAVFLLHVAGAREIDLRDLSTDMSVRYAQRLLAAGLGKSTDSKLVVAKRIIRWGAARPRW